MATHSTLVLAFASSQGIFSLRRVWAVAGAMLQAWQTRRQLAEIDGHLLADIGASRADAAMEANRPFWDIR